MRHALGTALYWRLRVVKRRVDNILECETLSIAWGSVVARFLTGLVMELQLSRQKIPPLLLNDNQSSVSHVATGNKHANPRLNVIWSTLCSSFSKNEFVLRWLCGKNENLGDVLTKAKSPVLLPKLLKALRTGKIFIPAK